MPASILIWSFILFALILAGFAGLALIRRRYFGNENFPREGFTMDDLRQMVQSGQMSKEEYEKARGAMMGQYTKKAADSGSSDKTRH
jgi:hypothetical protein